MLTKSNTIIDKHYRNYYQKKIQFNNEEMLLLGFTKVVLVRRYIGKKASMTKWYITHWIRKF